MERANTWRFRLVAAVAGALVLGLPGAGWAHGPPVAPGELWRTWTLDWYVLAGVFVPAWLYARGVRRLWGRAGVGRGVRSWQAGCFAAGIAALFVALISPLDALGGALFSAHMVQHMVLMLVAAPLLVLGNAFVPFVWALPPAWRRRIGGWLRHPDVRGVWYVFGNPVSAWLLHAAAIWVWHVPVLYEATLGSELVHIAQHAAFFGTAMLFWWSSFEMARRRRLRFGLGVIYVFTTMLHTSILSALLTFSLVLWYPIYAERTGAWGLTPLEDQQLGGLLMWVPAGAVYLAVALALMAAGLATQDRRGSAPGVPTARARVVPGPMLVARPAAERSEG